MPREKIVFTARPKIQSQSQIFQICLPHRPKFSEIFNLCLHWVSVVRVCHQHYTTINDCHDVHLCDAWRCEIWTVIYVHFHINLISIAHEFIQTMMMFNQPGAFCQYLFRWIYYYGSNKSTRKETGKRQLCALFFRLLHSFGLFSLKNTMSKKVGSNAMNDTLIHSSSTIFLLN